MKRLQRLRLHIKLMVLSFGLVLGAPLLVAAPSYALSSPASVVADAAADACAGIGLTGGDCKSDTGGTKINNTLTSIINIITSIVGVVALIMILVAGFKYITSGGDANKISSAKSTIIYAIVGLIVAALAQVIVHFVITQAKA
jgi:hypothetical protein